MRKIRAGLRLILILLHLIIGGLLTLLISPFQRRDMAHPAPAIVRWWHRRACKLLHLNIRVTGSLPAEGEFLVSNHVSWMDIPVLGSLGPISFVSKAEVRNWPLIGWLSQQAGTLFIHRGGGKTDQLKQEMLEKLKIGNHVLLFPEGTTTDGKDVRPFFPRLFAVAHETGKSIQPVALRYRQSGSISEVAPYIDDDVLLPHMWNVLHQDEIDVDVIFTSALAQDEGDRKSLANNARDAVVSALKSI